MSKPGDLRFMTPGEVVLAFRDPMKLMGVSNLKYKLAHDAVVQEVLFLMDKGWMYVFVQDEVLRIMKRAIISPGGGSLTPIPNGVYEKSYMSTAGIWRWYQYNQYLTGVAHHSWSTETAESKDDMTGPLLITPGENALGSLTALAYFRLESPLPVNLQEWWGLSDSDRQGLLFRAISGVPNDIVECALPGRFPYILFTPGVFEFTPQQGGRTRKLNATLWSLIFLEWDDELKMFLLSLPDRTVLEYVPLPDTEVKGEPEPVKVYMAKFNKSIYLAIGNAFLCDEDRDFIKTSGTGMTRLMENYWKDQARDLNDFSDLRSIALIAAAAEEHNEKTQGFERARR